jgi:hypothetical protein
MEMKASAFYYTAPLLLTLLFGYFHLQMQRLWERLAMLPAVFPDGKPVDRKVHPWLVTDVSRAHVKLLKEKGTPAFFVLQRFVVVLLVWVLVPVTIVYFTWMYPLSFNKWGGLFLHILSATVVSGSVMAYGKAARTLEQKVDSFLPTRRQGFRSEKDWSEIIFVKGNLFYVLFFLLSLTIWFGRFILKSNI